MRKPASSVAAGKQTQDDPWQWMDLSTGTSRNDETLCSLFCLVITALCVLANGKHNSDLLQIYVLVYFLFLHQYLREWLLHIVRQMGEREGGSLGQINAGVLAQLAHLRVLRASTTSTLTLFDIRFMYLCGTPQRVTYVRLNGKLLRCAVHSSGRGARNFSALYSNKIHGRARRRGGTVTHEHACRSR